jgi:phospholipid transport system substrate-binding protein
MNLSTRHVTILLVLFFLSSPSLDAQNKSPESNVLDMLKPNVQKTLSILQDSSLSRSEKQTKIENTLQDLFAYRLMGKLVLGKQHWSSMDDDQKDQYIKLLKETLKLSYFQKMEEVSGIQVVYGEPTQKGENKVYVPTTVQFRDEDLNVEYRLYRSGEADPWKVFDIVVKGVSIVKSYRSQYSDYLKDHSINQLMDRMAQKIDELKDEDGAK